jgi:hypothetical protein
LDTECAELTEQRHHYVFFDRKVAMEGASSDARRFTNPLDRRPSRAVSEKDIARSDSDVQAKVVGTPLAQRWPARRIHVMLLDLTVRGPSRPSC